MLILGLIIGTGLTSLFFISYIKNKYVTRKTIRDGFRTKPVKRGLLTKTLNWTDISNKSTKSKTKMEFEVVEENSKMVKIQIKFIKTDSTETSSDDSIKKILAVYSDSWYDKNDPDIIWFEDDLMEIRNKRLKNILSK
jgi:hypothetical protein